MVNIEGALGEGAVIAITIRAIDEFSSVLNNIGNALGIPGIGIATAGVTALAGASIGAIKELGDLAVKGAQATEVQSNFLATLKNGPSILKQMQDATLGVVDDTDLMASATQAVKRGVSEDLLPTIAKFSEQLAQSNPQFGSATENINAITRAIATGRSQMLSSMGIDINKKELTAQVNEEMKKQATIITDQEAAQEGLTIGSKEYDALLKENIKNTTAINSLDYQRTLILNAIKEASANMKDPVKDAKTETQALSANLQNMQEEIGKMVAPAFVQFIDALKPIIPVIMKLITDLMPVINKFLADMGKIIVELTKNFEDNQPILVQLINDFEALIPSIFQLAEVLLPVLRDILPLIDIGLQSVNAAIQVISIGLKGFIDLINTIIQPLREVVNLLNTVNNLLPRSNVQLTGNQFTHPVRTVHDAVITPKGEVIQTDMNDYLIATQNPQGLNRNITVNIGKIYGMNPKDVSIALKRELSHKISI